MQILLLSQIFTFRDGRCRPCPVGIFSSAYGFMTAYFSVGRKQFHRGALLLNQTMDIEI